MNKKLFLSYGHPEASICQKICDHLRANGFDVWMDLDDIKEGNDWRRKIFEGISESNGVLACLSRHSCRKPGVCLNELSIAVGVKGGNIKTILLENEEEVVPPAELCHSQWLDMHDWKEWESRGNEAFEDWFSSKMKTLVEMLKRDGEFAGEIESVRKILNPLISRSRQSALLAKAFWGRAWLADEVEKWLRDNDADRMLVLYGEPGIGKSAFAANYMHYHEKVVGGIFCERNHVHFNDPENIIRSISYQLACRLPAYRKALIQIFGNGDNLKDKTVSELFDMLLSEPLQHLYIDGGHENLCFIIDGLDECGDEKDNDLARTLKQYADRLPNWLRFLVTTRELASVTSIFGNMNSMKLQGSMERNMVDIRTYYESCLETELQQIPSESERNKVLDRLTEASKGVFLYAELMANSIHNGNQSITDLEHFPEGLSAMFYQWFEGSFPKHEEYEQKYRRFISTMLAIPEGIPTNMVTSLLGVDENREHDILLKMQILLANNTNWLGEKTWKFSHQYIGEWIRGEEAGRFYCSAEAGHKGLVEYLQKKFENDPKQMTVWETFTLLSYAEQLKEEFQVKVSKTRGYLEKAIAVGDDFVQTEEIYCARMCYDILNQWFIGYRNHDYENQSGKSKHRIRDMESGVRKRQDILNELHAYTDDSAKNKKLSQLMEEGYTAAAVEMVRNSLHAGVEQEKESRRFDEHSLIDKIADSILFHSFEDARNKVKSGIRELTVQEKDKRSFRGPILTIPMTIVVFILMAANFYFFYADGTQPGAELPYLYDVKESLLRIIVNLGIRCGILLGLIAYFKTDLEAKGKKREKSLKRLAFGMAAATVSYFVLRMTDSFLWFVAYMILCPFYIWLKDSEKRDKNWEKYLHGKTPYFELEPAHYWKEYWCGCILGLFLAVQGATVSYVRFFMEELWPFLIMALATFMLYREETYELRKKPAHPFLWSARYYGLAIALLMGCTYYSNRYVDFTDHICWFYMLLIADTAYLLFAKPRTSELIRFSKNLNRRSMFDLEQEEGINSQDIQRKRQKKMPYRIVATVLANIAAVVLLFATSSRVREIVRSIYYEIMGYQGWGNLGWISHRMQAISQSLNGDYSALNSDYFISQQLPMSWIHHHYGILVLAAFLIMIIVLLVMMKRYIQEDIESEFVVTVQKLILFSFIFQTVLGAAAELFMFTSTNVKIIFLGDESSILLWILFMKIGKKKNRV
ncbi:MAG: toll/interleukin-1 receptor domain-containing protein [Lachnospiraceae bacterium]|nr:toll/interleukin-1 receptor domain-containing protein [Lachnospiraceae bacterium]